MPIISISLFSRCGGKEAANGPPHTSHCTHYFNNFKLHLSPIHGSFFPPSANWRSYHFTVRRDPLSLPLATCHLHFPLPLPPHPADLSQKHEALHVDGAPVTAKHGTTESLATMTQFGKFHVRQPTNWASQACGFLLTLRAHRTSAGTRLSQSAMCVAPA